MHPFKQLLTMLLGLAILAGCAGGRSAFSTAEKLEREGRLDEAVLKYAEVSGANPDVGEYRARFLQASAAAAQKHLRKGNEFLTAKNYDDALREFQTAFALDSSLQQAQQQSELVIRLRNSLVYQKEGEEFEKNRKPREALRSYQKALEFNANNDEAKNAIDRLLKSKKPKMDGYELNLKSNKPLTLKFKDAKIKEIFNIISQLSGINFVFDEGVKDQNFSIYLENATFQQALDIICGVNKLGKKVLNENTIIIYTKSPEKTKQYEELVVQTFYLNKLDAKKAVNLIRTMLQVKKIYVNEEVNALVIRDTPEVIEVAQKILDANDVPDAEVVLEVEVIEISKGNTENFGLALSRYAVSTAAAKEKTTTFLSDVLVQPTSTTSSSSTSSTTASPDNLLTLFRWRGFNGFLTVPNATFNFGKTLSNSETLANPKIRVKNREKAKFNVGTRVPITTTSTNGTSIGVNVNVQYVDVGVKLNAEPTIQLNNEVAIKLSLEVSSILSKDKIGDASSLTTVVTIGTRNLDTVLSLKDGETSIIGGLIQDSNTKSKQKVMVLGDIPIIGPLLSSNDNSNSKSELVLAITPRVVRSVTVPEGEAAGFWSGKEDEPSLSKPYSSFVQEPELVPAVQTAPLPPAEAQTQPPATPAVKPETEKKAGPAAQPAPPVTAAPAPAPAAEQQPAPKVTLNLAAPASVKVNDQFTVEVKAANAANLISAPFTLAYDPIFLELVGVTEGPLMKKDGKPTTFRPTIDKTTGQVAVNLFRSPDTGGVSGSGTLVTVTFKAKNQGPASMGFLDTNFSAVGGKPVEAVAYSAVVQVQ
ncbi:cohesin domain-containing protein [Geotalea sp. SG265]|uniref:cohesin domain-containing protein n=1 Tax=Geotalea sp. SG265 TaxID=2922867 RepID=UPI001FB025F9|nr:cohesin domain-containing protein [Geotalea sp. SG265]